MRLNENNIENDLFIVTTISIILSIIGAIGVIVWFADKLGLLLELVVSIFVILTLILLFNRYIIFGDIK